jgi:hypothetical protein
MGNMFSTCPNQHSAIFQSATPALPFLFMGLIATISRWKNNTQFIKIQKELGGHFSTYVFILLFMVSVFFVSEETNGLIKSPGHHEQAINQVLTVIPDGSSVTVTNRIFPHICDRTEVYIPRFIDLYTPITDGDWGYPDKNAVHSRGQSAKTNVYRRLLGRYNTTHTEPGLCFYYRDRWNKVIHSSRIKLLYKRTIPKYMTFRTH